MDIKYPSEGQTVNWRYFPVINTLLHYLDRKDFIELSKCCKFYRKHFEKRVLGKLDLCYYKSSISKIYEGLKEARKIEKISELLKSDLGPKLKLVHSVNLDCGVSREFSESFVKLLPNVKTLRLDIYNGCGFGCGCEGDWQKGLIIILSCMSHLEHVEILLDGLPGKIINIKNQIFPKSLKSLNINLLGHFTMYEDDKLYSYDKIDSTYINLHTLTIISNRLLQNLSTGIPNLQNVKIKIMELDESKFIKFLKANPQLRNLETILEEYNEEIINTVLSSKHLKQWSIDSWIREDEEVRCHSTNYSIKYLRVFIELPDLTVFNIIDACKGLETLDYKREDFELTLSLLLKLKRKIDILKLSFNNFNPRHIEKIDASRLFNTINIEQEGNFYVTNFKDLLDQINSIKLKNYKFTTLTTKSLTLKLINKN